jgi:hypothetical protein
MDASRAEPSHEGLPDEPVTEVGAAASPPGVAGAAERQRPKGIGVALLLAAAAIVAAVITARASVVGGQATDLWQQSVREEERRGAILIQGVRFTYGEEGDVAFMIAMSEARAAALEEASASAAPDIAERLAAEAQVHAQVAQVMRDSVSLASDPRFQLPSGGYDLEAALAAARSEVGDDQLPDPLATVRMADEASRHAIRILAVTVVVGLAFLAGSLAQVLHSRRRVLLVAGWVTLLAAVGLAVVVEVSG